MAAWQADPAHGLARLEGSLAHALAQVQAIGERRIRSGTMPTEEVSGS